MRDVYFMWYSEIKLNFNLNYRFKLNSKQFCATFIGYMYHALRGLKLRNPIIGSVI